MLPRSGVSAAARCPRRRGVHGGGGVRGGAMSAAARCPRRCGVAGQGFSAGFALQPALAAPLEFNVIVNLNFNKIIINLIKIYKCVFQRKFFLLFSKFSKIYINLIIKSKYI